MYDEIPGLRTTVQCALCIAVFASAALPRAAVADDAESAKQHFQQGALLYNEGAFEKALVEFKESYAIKPNWKVRLSIGVTLHALHRFVEAQSEVSW